MEGGSVAPEGADMRMWEWAIRSEYDDETYNGEEEDRQTLRFRSIEHST